MDSYLTYLKGKGLDDSQIALLTSHAPSLEVLQTWLLQHDNEQWLLQSPFPDEAKEFLLRDARESRSQEPTDPQFAVYLKEKQAYHLLPRLEVMRIFSRNDLLLRVASSPDFQNWLMHESKLDGETAEGIIQESKDYTQAPVEIRQSSIQIIQFYKKGEPFYEFANFYPAPIIDDNGTVWATSEHYFQAAKFNGVLDSQGRAQVAYTQIRSSTNPRDAFERGRDQANMVVRRPDWEQIKENVMRFAVFRKFTQHIDLYHLLLSTGDAYIIEHTSNDNYWADGGDGTGKNKLGEILMELRGYFRQNNDSIRPYEIAPQL